MSVTVIDPAVIEDVDMESVPKCAVFDDCRSPADLVIQLVPCRCPKWRIIVCPKRGRVNWLSGSAAHRWVRHALALGAQAHVERGQVFLWEARP